MASTVSHQPDQKSRGLGKRNKQKPAAALPSMSSPARFVRAVLGEALPVQGFGCRRPLPQASAPRCPAGSCQPLHPFVRAHLSRQLQEFRGEAWKQVPSGTQTPGSGAAAPSHPTRRTCRSPQLRGYSADGNALPQRPAEDAHMPGKGSLRPISPSKPLHVYLFSCCFLN